MSGDPGARSANIQLLRVFAACGVVLFHLGNYASQPGVYGANYYKLWACRWSAVAALPVPLFFAVSGFVLTHALSAAEARDRATGRAGVAGRFVLARALRLYPGYWLALAIALGLGAVGVRLTESADDRLGGLPLALALAPPGQRPAVYLLGVEWSLVYEVFLSAALAALYLACGARRLPLAAGVWLALLLTKAVIAPGLGTAVLPAAETVAFSAYCAPFLAGVVAYPLRGRGGRTALRAASVAAPASWWAAVSLAASQEQLWLAGAVPAGLVVWLAVRLPQAPSDNRLVRLGDRTYGLYLLHVPLIRAGFALWGAVGIPARNLIGVAVVGAVALALGLAFGYVEARLDRALRPRRPAAR